MVEALLGVGFLPSFYCLKVDTQPWGDCSWGQAENS